MIKPDHIKKIFPNNKQPEALSEALNHILPKYDITTKQQVACFLGQCGHESGEFNVLKENLNYSAESLCKVWAKRFPSLEVAKPYNRNPEKIANKVYADRMGNGNEASGDGFKYRGRGCIQTTGKDNYTKFSKSCGKSLDETVAYCETLEGAIASGAYFWQSNNLNRFVQANDYVGLTKAINGGTHGLDDRTNKYKKALSVLDFDVLKKSDAPIAKQVKVEEPVGEPSIFDDIEKSLGEALDSVTKWFTD